MTKPRWLEPPDHLTAHAKKHWNYYAAGLFREGYLLPTTRINFARLCMLLGVIDACQDEINQNGVTLGLASGSRKSNPAVQTLFAAQRELAILQRGFGMGGRFMADGR